MTSLDPALSMRQTAAKRVPLRTYVAPALCARLELKAVRDGVSISRVIELTLIQAFARGIA